MRMYVYALADSSVEPPPPPPPNAVNGAHYATHPGPHSGEGGAHCVELLLRFVDVDVDVVVDVVDVVDVDVVMLLVGSTSRGGLVCRG